MSKKSIVIIGKHEQTINYQCLLKLIDIAKNCGYEIYVERKTILNNKLELKNIIPIELDNINEFLNLSFAIVIGGDGTMLGIARKLCQYNIPLIGINSGRLGFITDIKLEEIEYHITPILDGHYFIESRAVLEANIISNNQNTLSSLAINDVVVSRSIDRGMIDLSITVNDDYMCTQRADGLIVSTPTGSTAYALSVGGPIIHPQSNCLVLAPIAPHSLSDRPIVVPSNSHIKIKIAGNKSCVVNFDMQVYNNFDFGQEIHIKQSIHKVSFVHSPNYSYYETLRKKLNWQN